MTPSVPGPARLTLAVVGAVGVTAVGVTALPFVLAYTAVGMDHPTRRALLSVWVSLPYVLGGLVAWRRRPDSRFGPLLVTAGFANAGSTLQWAAAAPLFTLGSLFDLLPAVLFLHVFLAFPSGRLVGWPARCVTAAGYAAAVLLQVVVLLLGGFDERDVLAVADAPGAAEVVQNLQLLTLAAAMLAGAVLLVVGRPPLRGPRRRFALLVDAFVLALLAVGVLLVAGAFGWPGFEHVRTVTFLAIGLAPVAFLLELLDARLARSAVGDLMVRLHDEPLGDLREPLARALRDPSLRLAFWLPEYARWADRAGTALTLPAAGVTLIERAGEPVAALLHDPALAQSPELLDAVRAAAGIALEKARLEAELRARLRELHGSRLRVLEAQSRERRRLERDLHDGAQQRLVALALELGMLEQSVDGVARDRLGAARREVATSLAELRDLARGIHPAVLTGHGLAVALESLGAAAPVPVTLAVAVDRRLPEPVEVAAYYVVSEALANIGKHARARTAGVTVAVSGDRLSVEVCDDGAGGADPDRGSGLRGLADRVEALGGRLRIWTPAGGGTRVLAEIPCG